MPSPFTGSESETLERCLDEQRTAIISAIEGLDERQARWRPHDEANSLIEILNHLAWVERWWFECVFAGSPDPWPADDPDADFKVPDDQTVRDTIDLYRAACRRSKEISESASLDTEVEAGRGRISLRWITVHMIEETARHAGHADITRQLIDGRRAT